MSKMQASAYAVKANPGLQIQNRGGLPFFGELRSRNTIKDLRMTERSKSNCFGFRLSSGPMESELSYLRIGVERAPPSSVKSRSVRAQASGMLVCFEIAHLIIEVVAVFAFCCWSIIENFLFCGLVTQCANESGSANASFENIVKKY